MPFSKRKPYLKDEGKTAPGAGNMSLKRSISSFFRAPVRYLKESNEKESQFEKPYNIGDYPSMHLNLPRRSWPSSRYKYPPSVFGTGGPRSKIHTIIYADPSCHTGAAQLGCGGSDSLYFSIWNTPPAALGGEWVWDVFIDGADPDTLSEDITISKIRLSGLRNQIATVTLSSTEEAEEGTVTICGATHWAGTPPLKSIVVDVPEGANPFHIGSQAMGRPYQVTPIRPSRELARLDNTKLLCCQDVSVEGCCGATITSWDESNSASTVAREANATVYVTGSGASIDWTVSGVGFWLDAGYSITSLAGQGTSVEIYCDESACGIGTITATSCDGTTATGYIRCTTGFWAGCSPYEIIWLRRSDFIGETCDEYMGSGAFYSLDNRFKLYGNVHCACDQGDSLGTVTSDCGGTDSSPDLFEAVCTSLYLSGSASGSVQYHYWKCS